MQAMIHAAAPAELLDYVEPLDHVEPRREVAPALREATPELFRRVVGSRTHDGAALAAALLLVSTLIGLGVWMVMDVAEGLELARYCNGQCTEVRR